MTEDEIIVWHHQLDGHAFEQAPGVGDGQRSLACYSPWDRMDHAWESQKGFWLKQSPTATDLINCACVMTPP